MAEETMSTRNDRYVSSTFPVQATNNDWIIECLKTRPRSIEEAVTSLVEFVPEVKSSAATAKRDCRQNSPLTINESAAIYLYSMTGSFYCKLNEALRAENPSALGSWFPYLKLFLTALSKLQSCSTTVWRGVWKNIGNEFAEGSVHTWSSMNSCSPHVNVAGCFTSKVGTLFCIHTIRGKDITAYAANQTEEEILLRPGIRLRVKSVKLECDGLSVVHLEEW
jgi:hypothetical protein